MDSQLVFIMRFSLRNDFVVILNDVMSMLVEGSVSSNGLEKLVKKMCKEGANWGKFVYTSADGDVAGVYVGLEYGMERVRGTRDWISHTLNG
ncbi:hypothetical protein C5167_016243 [Papaver somniferum]|nr:hypothetical protein C5167_016243 [Papaver somniferum]